MSSKAARIILVEDDDSVREAIVAYLGRHDFDVSGARDASEFDALSNHRRADIIILDIMLPGEDGLSICRRLRDGGPPVLILSALGDTTDRIVGLEIGAADYLAKPFDPRELLARVRAILRREAPRTQTSEQSFQFEGWLFEPGAARLTAPDGTLVPLPAGELRMLLAFVQHPAQVLSRDKLLDLTHETPDGPFDRAIDIAVSRLRRRLSAADGSALIETMRGLGYRFRVPVLRR
ncbi:response regulator [Dyella subtropica]|uniref:response regulator n=1 Tax=Dyella subtropica TaxID=2992127 RepID=UPI002255FCCC|nr:response regulator transcription factor [Dyella subtropica]